VLGKVDLDPGEKIDENHPTFDEPMVEVQLGAGRGQ